MKIRDMVTLFAFASLASVAGLASLPGCSSDDPATSAGSSGSVPGETVSVAVSAAEGGKVSDASGSVVLTIPPGALEKDTTITLAVGAQTAATIAAVYDFGPDGLEFLKPVSLQIKATVPDGKSAAIAYESGGAWKPLSGTTVDKAAGTVTASTDHFTKYSVVVVDGQGVLEPPASCTQAAAEFTPCGGDPTGTWTFAEFCVDAKNVNDPFKGKCPSGTATIDHTSTRTLTIDATTITNSPGTETTKTTLAIPPSCLSDNSVTCSQLTNPDKNLACTDSGGNCTCEENKVEQKQESKQTYTTSGNTITITSSSGSVDTGEYCVKQNLLWFRQIGGDGVLYVLNRK